MQNLPTAIDSLNAKILLMQNEISSLKGSNKAMFDSLTTINKTIEKADIATTFYDTHLATYTTIISIIIALIAIIGWRSLVSFKLNPLDKKIEELKNTTIPNLIDEIKKENEKELKNLDEKNKVLAKTATRAIYWGLNSFQTLYLFQNDYSMAFIYNLRLLKTICEGYEYVNDRYKQNKGFEQVFSNNLLYLESNLFDYTKIEKFHDEIDRNYDSLIISPHEFFVEFAKKSRKIFYKKINQSSIEMENLNFDDEDFDPNDFYFNQEEDFEEDEESPNSSSPKADDE